MALNIASAQRSTLVGRSVHLAPFEVDHVSQRYVEWLNDDDVVRYLEVRFSDREMTALRQSTESRLQNRNLYFYAVFDSRENTMVGTCSLTVKPDHRMAGYGYLIGDKQYWGSDVALQAQVLLFDLAFRTLGLRKVTGGAYSANRSSHFNMRRLGFVREGVRRQEVFDFEGNPVDLYEYGLLASEWLAFGQKYDVYRRVVAED